MDKAAHFVIPGEPQGKARARVYSRTIGNGTDAKTVSRAVTPEKTVLYENLIKTLYRGPQFDGPVAMEIRAFYTIPKSTTKKNRQLMIDGLYRPCKKPDADNVIKVVADALNGIAYRDDAQVVQVVCAKFYADAGARVEVEIREA